MEEWEEPGADVVKRFMYVNRRAPCGTTYALECLDIAARGLGDAPLIEGLTIVDYEGFVDLVVEHAAPQSWL